FYDIDSLVNINVLQSKNKEEILNFYQGEGSLKQFFFSTITSELNADESPFVIGYLTDLLSDKFLKYDFSNTGRKSMWTYLDNVLLEDDFRGLEFLSQKYQNYAELALFHAGFLRNYDENKGTLNL